VIRTAGHSYSVRRILKIGLDEYLVYLRPADDPFPRLRREGQERR